ncbi:alpha-glucan water dikinase, chloroplastic-like [Triticum urartu]|uniref:alpha-glucan water dikinase, chloroplastic-like n=1 Tax=Triticum urartu TaxID=4572 RepID=UPI00204346EC|nr:alpha-glucan water dikinase, chloroplastic-like [Triticum urartu]
MAGSYAATALAAAGRCAPGFRAPAVDGPRTHRWAPPPTRFGAGRRLHAAVSSRHRRRVVAAASQNGGKFGLGANSELQVTVKPAGSAVEVELVATNAGGALALHWGALQQGRREWVLPARRPEGTKTVDDAALRTPFKSVRFCLL